MTAEPAHNALFTGACLHFSHPTGTWSDHVFRPEYMTCLFAIGLSFDGMMFISWMFFLPGLLFVLIDVDV